MHYQKGPINVLVSMIALSRDVFFDNWDQAIQLSSS